MLIILKNKVKHKTHFLADFKYNDFSEHSLKIELEHFEISLNR